MVEQNISIVCISPAAAHKKEDRGGSFLSPRHYKFLKPYNMILIHSVKLEWKGNSYLTLLYVEGPRVYIVEENVFDG